MADARFFRNHGPFTLERLAEASGARPAVQADGGRTYADVAPLDTAGPGDVTFLDNVKYADALAKTRAGACILRPEYADRAPEGVALLLSDDPYRGFAKIAALFYPEPEIIPGISAQAAVDATAEVHATARVEAFAFIGPHARIGARSVIAAGAYVGQGVTVGDDCRVGPQVTLQCAMIGNRVILHPGVRIGQDGFGFAMGAAGHLKVPQLGRVVIDDDVEIGANTCIDRGAGPDTRIGAGTKIDNLVQIGHNVTIGRLAVIVSQVGISGSTRIGDGAVLGGQVGVAGHLDIGPGARVAAQSGVVKNIPAGQTYGGYPAVPVKDWHRQSVMLARRVREGRKAQDKEPT